MMSLRRALVDYLKSWSFTRYERRALLLFIALILTGSTFRYYHYQTASRKLEAWNRQGSDRSDSLDRLPKPYGIISPVDINLADPLQLQSLPGVGPVMAKRIVEWREVNGRFRGLDDLESVKGIGPALRTRLAGLVTFESIQADSN